MPNDTATDKLMLTIHNYIMGGGESEYNPKKYSLDLFNLLNTIRNNPKEFVKILKKFKNEHIKNNSLTYLGKTIKLGSNLNTLEENIDNLEHIDSLNKILKSIKLRINLPEGSMKGNLFDYLLKECNQIKEKYEFEYFDYVYIEGYGTPEEVACVGFCDDKLNESKIAKLILNPNFNQGEIFVLNKNILFIILAGETEDF